jgi:hypothetical protein
MECTTLTVDLLTDDPQRIMDEEFILIEANSTSRIIDLTPGRLQTSTINAISLAGLVPRPTHQA